MTITDMLADYNGAVLDTFRVELTGATRDEALEELREELREFCDEGLAQLAADLANKTVMRGSWGNMRAGTKGCPLSYVAGHAASCDYDRNGDRANAFTAWWDNGFLSHDAVAQLVAEEVGRRATAEPEWVDEPVIAEPAAV